MNEREPKKKKKRDKLCVTKSGVGKILVGYFACQRTGIVVSTFIAFYDNE